MNGSLVRRIPPRRFIVALLAVIAGAGLSLPFLDQASVRAGEKADLPIGLGLVPPESLGLIHLRVGDLWGSELAVKLKQQFPKETFLIQSRGINPAEVDSVCIVFPGLDSLTSIDKISLTEPMSPPAKEASRPAKIGIIVSVNKPPNQDRIAALVLGGAQRAVEKYKGKTIVSSKSGSGLAVCFTENYVYMVSNSVDWIKEVVDGPVRFRPQGPLAPALELAAKKHAVVIGLNLGHPEIAELKKEWRVGSWEWGVKRQLLTANSPLPTLLRPLLDAKSASLAIDLDKEGQLLAKAELTFIDPDQAAQGANAAQDAVALLRMFVAASVKWHYRSQAIEADNALDAERDLFFSLLAGNIENALRGASSERRQAVVHLAGQARCDPAALKAQARTLYGTAIKAEAVDPLRLKRIMMDNLKHIAVAMQNYHQATGTYPPAALTGEDGKQLLSWRVAILPFINEAPLFAKFNLKEPWDGPNNIKLLPLMPKVFAPPPGKTKQPGSTFYQVLVGKGTPFESMTGKGKGKGISIVDITHGTANTLGVVEAADPVPWTKPADIAYDPAKPLPRLGGVLVGNGFHAAFMDGSTRFFDLGATSEKALRVAIARKKPDTNK